MSDEETVTLITREPCRGFRGREPIIYYVRQYDHQSRVCQAMALRWLCENQDDPTAQAKIEADPELRKRTWKLSPSFHRCDL
jgi:hypothetical protein